MFAIMERDRLSTDHRLQFTLGPDPSTKFLKDTLLRGLTPAIKFDLGAWPQREVYDSRTVPKTPAATPFMTKNVAAAILKTLLRGLAPALSFGA